MLSRRFVICSCQESLTLWFLCISVLFSGWVNELVGGQHSGAKGFMFFGVNVDLTENGIGITHVLLVLFLIFAVEM